MGPAIRIHRTLPIPLAIMPGRYGNDFCDPCQRQAWPYVTATDADGVGAGGMGAGGMGAGGTGKGGPGKGGQRQGQPNAGAGGSRGTGSRY
jgi:hypothetical protein